MGRRGSGQLGFALDGFDERRPRRAKRSLDEKPDASRVDDDARGAAQHTVHETPKASSGVVDRGDDALQGAHEVGGEGEEQEPGLVGGIRPANRVVTREPASLTAAR